MKKIFLVTEYIQPSQNTVGYLFHKLYLSFKKNYGDDLQVITKEDGNYISDSNFIFVKNCSLNKKKLIQRLIFESIISFRFFLKILKNVKKGDLVFTGTTPIFLLLIIYIAKKIMRFKWVLLVHDVFPENLIAAKILKEKNIFYNLLKKIFDCIYAMPEKLIVIGQDMQDLVNNKTNKKNSVVVQNWIDVNDIQVENKHDNLILQKLNWQNEGPIFQFFGNIGRVQGIENIIKAIELIDQQERPKFLFIGDGAYAYKLKEMINQLDDPNIKFIGSVHQNEKSKGLNACDIAVVTLAEGMLGLGVPSKAYFSMAANKPILAIMHERSEVSCMLKQHKIGWVVPAEEPKLLAQKILSIAKDYEKQMLPFTRNVLIEHYSEQVAMKKIVEILHNI